LKTKKWRVPDERTLAIILATYCSHHIAISADQWPDDVRLSDIEGRFLCKACGNRGADIRPNFSEGKMSLGY
jgi:hypothetical protein